MHLSSHSNKDNARRTAVAVLTLLMAATGTGRIAGAQSVDNAGFDPLSNEQDSLLPPEVVPLDPTAANSMTAAQAANRQMRSGNDVGSVPGLVSNPNKNGNGTISARDFRRDAFNSLYNQNQGGLQQQQQPGQTGGASYNNQGQNAAMNSQFSSPSGQTPPYTGQVDMASANAQPVQSQSLTGASNNQPAVQNTQRGGFTNNASGAAALGMGAMSALYLMRPTNMLMGLGMWAMMLNGFGNRNGFRL